MASLPSPPATRYALGALASAVLATALAMAAVSAWLRGSTTTERLLLLSLSATVVLAVHLMPALIRKWTVWPLWAVCLICAVYGHAAFFASAAEKVAEHRGQSSAESRALTAQMDEIRRALDSIRARPIAQVSALLARSRSPMHREALQAELEESHRAADLRDQLITLSARQVHQAIAIDPVTAQTAQVTGASPEAVSLFINILMAVTLELVGILLWREFFAARVQTHGRRRRSA